jgi:hypothetical protein
MYTFRKAITLCSPVADGAVITLSSELPLLDRIDTLTCMLLVIGSHCFRGAEASYCWKFPRSLIRELDHKALIRII